MPRKSEKQENLTVVEQLDAYRPDMKPAASVALPDFFKRQLSTAHTIDPNLSDVEALYEARVLYLINNPQDIKLTELAKASQNKAEVEVGAGEELTRLLQSFSASPVTFAKEEDGE